jgi:hypothetical protein
MTTHTRDTKHTPGPWHVTGSADDGTSITNKQGASIARWPLGHELMFKDAALIAGAPDLLASLEEMVRVWEGPRERAALRFAAAVSRARVAIALARGAE